MTSSPLLQSKTLRATGFFKSSPSCNQFVSIIDRMGMQLESSFMGSLRIKAKLSKTVQSVGGIDRASHTKEDGVECDFFSLQALAKSLMLFARGLQLVSRPGIFTVFYFYEVDLPLVGGKLVSSACSYMVSGAPHLFNWEVSLSLTDKRASKSQLVSVLLLACAGI